ncbi:hypothetical protein ValSw33_38 [Vibrio phage ValSw3-3]|nr:hypothetical protein ValSw33_38 [Vibrio phage ValSw3-3]
MSEFNELHEHLKECVDNDLYTGITQDGVEFNIFEWAFGLSVKAKKEHDSLVEIANKHATRADELYEFVEKVANAKVCNQEISGQFGGVEEISYISDIFADRAKEIIERTQIDAVSNSNDD